MINKFHINGSRLMKVKVYVDVVEDDEEVKGRR